MSLFRFDFDITNDSDEGKKYHAIEKDSRTRWMTIKTRTHMLT